MFCWCCLWCVVVIVVVVVVMGHHGWVMCCCVGWLGTAPVGVGWFAVVPGCVCSNGVPLVMLFGGVWNTPSTLLPCHMVVVGGGSSLLLGFWL